jgi:hypothetical protein
VSARTSEADARGHQALDRHGVPRLPGPDPAQVPNQHGWYTIEERIDMLAAKLAAAENLAREADAAYQELDREFQAASEFLPSDWRRQAQRHGHDIEAQA